MKVVIDEKYSYECDFEVVIGDLVVLPSAKNFKTWVGKITGFESNYTGPMKKVMEIHKRVPRLRSIINKFTFY